MVGVTPQSHQAPRWYQHPRAIKHPDGTRRNTWEQLDAQTAACVTLGSHQVPRWKHSHQVPRWHQALYLGAIRCISIDPSLALHHPTPSTLYSGVPRSSCGNRTQTWKPGNRCGNRCGNCWESVGNHGILIILKKRIPIPFLFLNIKNTVSNTFPTVSITVSTTVSRNLAVSMTAAVPRQSVRRQVARFPHRTKRHETKGYRRGYKTPIWLCRRYTWEASGVILGSQQVRILGSLTRGRPS